MVSTLLNFLGTWLACSTALGLFLGRVMAAQVEDFHAPATRLHRHHSTHAA
jgi:hypothetical protein